MKAIILAAGEGKRLRPLTDNKPKCLVEYQGKPILDYQLETLRSCGINDIVVVKGYQAEILQREGVRFIVNPDYAATNMVYTLFCAEQELMGDTIISYGDIIYNKQILEKLLNCEDDIAVIVDKKWRLLWKQRMTDPLMDAETMKISSRGEIIELGRKPKDYNDIQGQYIGLIGFSANVIDKIKNFYYSLEQSKVYDGMTFKNMYMTSFIQEIIDHLIPVKAVFIEGGWIEIDRLSDLSLNCVL
jgi:choline kinase